MHMMFSGFPQSAVQQQPQTVTQNAGANPAQCNSSAPLHGTMPQGMASHMMMGGMGYGGLPGNPLPQFTSNSSSIGGSSEHSGASSTMVGAQASNQNSHSHQPGEAQCPSPMPFMLLGGTMWPQWGMNTHLQSFSNASANMGAPSPQTQNAAPCTAVAAALPSAGTLHSIEGLFEESTRTRQRKLQRLAKTAFNKKMAHWPMKIPGTDGGGIDLSHRIFVHRIFRATAKQLLDLSIIRFRDQPDAKIKRLGEQLNLMFVFDPPLRDGYTMHYIEETIRTSRYQWRKYWRGTGCGQKHPTCPEETFPSLHAY